MKQVISILRSLKYIKLKCFKYKFYCGNSSLENTLLVDLQSSKI